MPPLSLFNAIPRASFSHGLRRLHTSVPCNLRPCSRSLKALKTVPRKPTRSGAQPAGKSFPATAIKTAAETSVKEHHGPRYIYPEQLLIYHAGTGKLVFLSITKLTGVLLVIFISGVVFPAYYYSPTLETWQGAAYLAASFLPLIVTVYAKPPFVSYVHLRLPQWARSSRERLLKYAKNLPSSAEMEITALKWVLPRVTRLRAGELSIHQGTVTGAMTLRRTVSEQAIEAKRWYHWSPYRKFLISGMAGAKTQEPNAFPGVLESIARSWPSTRKALEDETRAP